MPQATIRSIKIHLAIWAVLIFIGMGLLALDARDSRQDNCQITEEAFDAYTDGLVAAVTGPNETKEQQAATAAAVERLNATYRPFFDQCG